MLRGYDPLREICHWQFIVAFFLMGIFIVSYFLSPAMDTISSLDMEDWSFYTSMVLIVLFPLILASIVLWALWRYRRAKRRRDMLRLAAFAENNPPLAPFQPAPVFWQALPLRIESHLRKNFTLWITLEVVFVVINFLANYAASNNLWKMPSLVSSFAGLLFFALFYSGIGIGAAIQNCSAAYYLLPWLQVNEEGITARYGRDTIPMRWQDIRSFALVSTMPVTFIREKAASRAKKYEAFEISDGENMICWRVATPPRSYRLRQNGEVALSPQDYAAFTQQLAALIVERTGLPLYDFRPPERKTKKR
jgi:hypothetical protein